jgi:hypothetical protein
VRPNASENNQINSSTIIRPAQGDGSRPNLASALQEGRKSANIHVRSGAIWGIPVTRSYDDQEHNEGGRDSGLLGWNDKFREPCRKRV